MTIIFDGTQGITTPTETANNSVTTPVVKSGSALTLQTNGSTTAVTIDTSQNVGIGTISPQMRVDVSGGVRVQSITNPTSGSGMELAYDGTQGIIQAYSNRATLASVPVYLVTGQLKFPPTQNPSSDANTLDDYEEGTWTPIDSSGAGLTFTPGGTARYTKIGRLVFVSFYINFPSTSNTTQVSIGGLPFSAIGSETYHYLTGRASGYATPVAQIQTNTTGFALFANGNTGLNNNQMSGSYLILSGCYVTT